MISVIALMAIFFLAVSACVAVFQRRITHWVAGAMSGSVGMLLGAAILWGLMLIWAN